MGWILLIAVVVIVLMIAVPFVERRTKPTKSYQPPMCKK